MANRVTEVKWWEFSTPEATWEVVFTGPGLTKWWSGDWCARCIFDEQRILLDPRPSAHVLSGWAGSNKRDRYEGIRESVQHEILHLLRGPYVDLRRDEPMIRKVSPMLFRILRPTMPPIPDNLGPLQRLCYRYDAAKRKGEREFWS